LKGPFLKPLWRIHGSLLSDLFSFRPVRLQEKKVRLSPPRLALFDRHEVRSRPPIPPGCSDFGHGFDLPSGEGGLACPVFAPELDCLLFVRLIRSFFPRGGGVFFVVDELRLFSIDFLETRAGEFLSSWKLLISRSLFSISLFFFSRDATASRRYYPRTRLFSFFSPPPFPPPTRTLPFAARLATHDD